MVPLPLVASESRNGILQLNPLGINTSKESLPFQLYGTVKLKISTMTIGEWRSSAVFKLYKANLSKTARQMMSGAMRETFAHCLMNIPSQSSPQRQSAWSLSKHITNWSKPLLLWMHSTLSWPTMTLLLFRHASSPHKVTGRTHWLWHTICALSAVRKSLLRIFSQRKRLDNATQYGSWRGLSLSLRHQLL